MMSEYCSVRVWQLKVGASATELETLAASGVAEMHRWIPGIKQLSLVRTAHIPETRYLMLTTFTDYQAYITWRRIEEEGPDYWERFASVFMHWEQLARLVEEYSGDSISLMAVDRQELAGIIT
jgi:hypothetical protein